MKRMVSARVTCVRRWTALVMVAAVAAVFGALGCAERITNVDPSFTSVEGVASPSQLIVFPDLPNQGLLFRDTLESGPGNGGLPDRDRDFHTFGPGVVRGMIVATHRRPLTRCSGRVSNGGFQEIRDFG